MLKVNDKRSVTFQGVSLGQTFLYDQCIFIKLRDDDNMENAALVYYAEGAVTRYSPFVCLGKHTTVDPVTIDELTVSKF